MFAATSRTKRSRGGRRRARYEGYRAKGGRYDSIGRFTCDDLNRLVGATGTYQNSPDKTNRYTLSQGYDNLHDLTSKQQVNQIVQPSGSAITQQPTTYTFGYAYSAVQPHAPSHIGQQTFTYDANGNQTGFTDDTNGQRRSIVWDENNHVQSLSENGHTMTYKYDDAGQRVIKRGPQGETDYVNQWFSIRNGQVGTKNVFVGTTRLASKLMMQNVNTFEKDQFFYHADGLNSTNYVTDTRGRVFEHEEYFPSGETGMSAWIPGHGTVSDDVGADLQDAGRGNEYLLENKYSQTVSGTYTIRPWYRPNSSSFTWSGP